MRGAKEVYGIRGTWRAGRRLESEHLVGQRDGVGVHNRAVVVQHVSRRQMQSSSAQMPLLVDALEAQRRGPHDREAASEG